MAGLPASENPCMHVWARHANDTERTKKQEALLLKHELNTINFLKQCYNDPALVLWSWEDDTWNESCLPTDECLIVGGTLTAHSPLPVTEHILCSYPVIAYCLFCMHNRKGGFVLSNRSCLCLTANPAWLCGVRSKHTHSSHRHRLSYRADNARHRQKQASRPYTRFSMAALHMKCPLITTPIGVNAFCTPNYALRST